eukprot:4026869-Amphidinium_carterae.1
MDFAHQESSLHQSQDRTRKRVHSQAQHCCERRILLTRPPSSVHSAHCSPLEPHWFNFGGQGAASGGRLQGIVKYHGGQERRFGIEDAGVSKPP